MKKKSVLILLAAAALAMTACGSKEAATDSAETASDDAASDEDSSDEDASADAEDAEADTSEKTVSGDAIVTDYGSVILADYKGLAATETVTTVSDEDIDYEVDNLLQDYVSYEEIDTGAEDGDVVYAFFTAENADGDVLIDYSETNEDLDGEPYDLYIGYQEYGEEFDEQITGARAGDTLEFTITFDDNAPDDALADQTVTFKMTVDHVETPVTPELDDTFIQETLGYDSEEAMRDALAEELLESNATDAEDETRESLIQQVIDASEITDYDEDFYQSAYDSVLSSYESYMSWFGYDDVDTFLEDMGIADEDLEDEALNETYRYIVVSAIAEREGLTPSDTEYEEALEDYAAAYGYESSDELLEDYGEDSVRAWLLDEKVLDFLYENADITQEEVSSEELEEEYEEEDS